MSIPQLVVRRTSLPDGKTHSNSSLTAVLVSQRGLCRRWAPWRFSRDGTPGAPIVRRNRRGGGLGRRRGSGQHEIRRNDAAKAPGADAVAELAPGQFPVVFLVGPVNSW